MSHVIDEITAFIVTTIYKKEAQNESENTT